jgi:integrase
MLAPLNMPLLPAVEEYVKCRQLLGEVPMLVAVQEFLRRTKGTTLGKKVPETAAEMIGAKQQDGLSTVYIGQLKTAAGRFAKAFPGEIMAISSGDIDRWLRKLGGSPVTRNSVHRCIKVLFSFAKARGYLPGAERTAAAMLPLAKEGDVETEIFTPEQIRRILCACPEHLLGYVALGAFAGLRVAEICRLNWSSVDLERRIVMLRADQAKTASRRIVPISENLAAWLSHIVHVRGAEEAGPRTDPAAASAGRGSGWWRPRPRPRAADDSPALASGRGHRERPRSARPWSGWHQR